MPPLRRVLRALRWAALLSIVVGPIGVAAVEVRGGAPVGVMSRELTTSDERVADYLRERSPLVDRLLPDGAGGTRFYEDLGGFAGLAFTGAAAIGLSASAGRGAWRESVELHERAHLVDAFLPAQVAALMARLPAAALGELAADNRGQHFAEMAANAWEIVSPPSDSCIDATPASRLEHAEARVPGTAGFVQRFLRVVPVPEAGEGLAAMAARLSAPHRDQWNAIWRGLDARRRPDGTFDPWRRQSIREHIASERAALWMSDSWLDRIASVGLLPSLAITTAAAKLTMER